MALHIRQSFMFEQIDYDLRLGCFFDKRIILLHTHYEIVQYEACDGHADDHR